MKSRLRSAGETETGQFSATGGQGHIHVFFFTLWAAAVVPFHDVLAGATHDLFCSSFRLLRFYACDLLGDFLTMIERRSVHQVGRHSSADRL